MTADGASSAQVRQFRTWWRLAFVQHLIASGRFRDVPREAAAVHPPEEDAEAVAALALLRGVALETRARLADEAPTGTAAVSMRRLPVASRTGPMLIAMDDAGKQYRRALELLPGDREATLRLARVAIERDRLDEAERLLAPLLSQPCRDAVCGLAHLFAGEVHEGRKDMERAVGCVRACLRRSRGAPLRAGGDDAGRACGAATPAARTTSRASSRRPSPSPRDSRPTPGACTPPDASSKATASSRT